MRSLRAKRAKTLVLKMRRSAPVRSQYYSTMHYSFKFVLCCIRRDVELLVRVMRMRADRAGYVGESLRDRQHLRVALDARRDRHDAPDAGGLRACHHGVELGREIGKIEMAVAVDEHHQAG